jgi:hypothetical protein
MKKNTKLYQVLNHLKRYGKLTQRKSVDLYNDYRLAAKIGVLIHDYGYNITCEMRSFTDYNGNKSRYGEYTLHQNPPLLSNKYGNYSRKL